jgi:hypothetical protein
MRRTTTLLAVLAISLLPTLALPAGADSTTTSSSTTTPPSTSSTTTTTTPIKTTTTLPRNNPFTVPAVLSYLKSRTNLTTAAIYDVESKQTYLYHPGVHERTASMIKIDILATLLYQSQLAKRGLTPSEKYTATEMIEYSDNDAATDLWNLVGGWPAIAHFNALMGYTQTLPNDDWGLIETTPKDQLQLLKTITLPNKLLDPASQAYEQYLMEHIVSYERFGLGNGTPAYATVGFKNGWYPETDTGWQTNTSGFVKYKKRFYLVTIMCTDQAGEDYGTDTLTTLSSLIWRTLRP